jgi:hypothetical protein
VASPRLPVPAALPTAFGHQSELLEHGTTDKTTLVNLAAQLDRGTNQLCTYIYQQIIKEEMTNNEALQIRLSAALA